ncbi:rhomboid family intramembrane serine protease [Nakamurella flavida]|uniref:Rhomboid family intramembrane serine protease n=1 Tax=Nakamurella flavida TaxID=363630 RepID=A0A939C202_9ACTN|nr:rhomboid family intramembrane serine protease [Nakamurella flavida]MBM9478228.1 rhomboid family intramembrane serine protease [Nakamurella flavida]MDP9778550.1 membrane associated rhomboid family serine protease [Nakamurella flavida]
MTHPPTGPSPWGGPVAAHQPACTWHADRATGLACTRCGRPACPECLRPASVGFHCRACVAEGRATTVQPTTIAGSRFGQQPVVTYALIAVNVAIFLVTAIQARSGMQLGGSTWFAQGSLLPELVASGEWWRLLTSGFLHVSVPHVALNMLSLYVLGLPLERILGRGRFVVVYLLALLGGSAAVMLFSDPLGPTAGASGAIFGLMGALVVTFRRLKYDPRQLLTIVALNLVLSLTLSGISWQAHLGGLAVGAAVGAVMVYPPRVVRNRWQLWGSVGILAVLVLIVTLRLPTLPQDYCSTVTSGDVTILVPCE